ncbi:tetratricopeptide repeat protein [Roseobacter sp. EG26]|uniref:tetratricopeptide repeat protein n=1 Tax=Roseobacter sp. EG26 TaxID=3412477 RepID=UPI003CE55C57
MTPTQLILSALIFVAPPAQSSEDVSLVSQGLNALEIQDFSAATAHFSEAFETGDADGAFYLGRMLELGVAGDPNRKAAIGLYKAGSEKGSAPAKNRLGVLHIQGNGVLQDFIKGAQLVCDAASLGDVNGAYNCGLLIREGRGVEKDETAAYAWLAKASELGHTDATNEYALGLIEGRFVEQNLTQAVELLRKTSNGGSPAGLFALAQVHAAGLGVDQDVIQAHAYFNLAAALDHPLAAQARNVLQNQMTASEVARAQERARSWRPVKTKKTN